MGAQNAPGQLRSERYGRHKSFNRPPRAVQPRRNERRKPRNRCRPEQANLTRQS